MVPGRYYVVGFKEQLPKGPGILRRNNEGGQYDK